MTKIIRVLTATKELNKVTSEWVACWTKGVEVQRMHKAFVEATEETKI